MKIMIAVDDSRNSEFAVEFVTRLRWPAGSRMVAVSALPPALSPLLISAMPADALTVPSVDSVARAEATLQVHATLEHAETLLRAAGFCTEGRLLEGDPREAILSAAEAEHADLLVLGCHGRSGLAKLLLGSVSSHAVTHATCSVLVVKAPAGS